MAGVAGIAGGILFFGDLFYSDAGDIFPMNTACHY